MGKDKDWEKSMIKRSSDRFFHYKKHPEGCFQIERNQRANAAASPASVALFAGPVSFASPTT